MNWQKLLNKTLIVRATYIWRQSTAKQRKGYFLAGVGLETGKKLDDIAEQANQLLVDSNNFIIEENFDEAISAITQLAKMIFNIETFSPKKLPENWENILEIWLMGYSIIESITDDSEISDILQFVEDSFVYRLPWGIEAIRVRAEANGDIIQDEMTIDVLETDVTVPAVENGTFNRSAAMLMQAGFNSRQAAIKAVVDTDGNFSNTEELSKWLKSKKILEATVTGDWPTPATEPLWREFVENFKPTKNKIWSSTFEQLPVRWNTKPYPASGTKVRLVNSKSSTNVIGADGSIIGKIFEPIKILENGVYYATISDNYKILDVEYLGAGKNPFSILH